MEINVNGRVVPLGDISPETPLLYVLRNDLAPNTAAAWGSAAPARC